MKVNMTPNPLDVVTIHASQGDTEAREWEFELHNNGELIDTSEITEQMFFKSYKGGTEQILPENTSTPTTSPFLGDIRYPQGLLTDQEFTYRQSPTEEDGLAKITDIKGNTLVWNQLVENGNFADTSKWLETRGTISASSNVLSYTISEVGSSIMNRIQNNNAPLIQNHKYLMAFDIKPLYTNNIYCFSVTSTYGVNTLATLTPSSANTWNRMSCIFTNSLPSTLGVGVAFECSTNYALNDVIQLRNYVLFDLTKMGLDITSPSDFTSLFPLSYYSFNQGSLLSFNGTGIKTVGKNLLNVRSTYTNNGITFTNDNGVITINGTATANAYFATNIGLPNGSYFIGAFNDEINSYVHIAIQNKSGAYPLDATMSSKNRTLSINNDIDKLIIYVNSGETLNNFVLKPMISFDSPEYFEPYIETTTDLPISTYFPIGMKSAGTVYDELTPRKAITRVGTVTLNGTEIWHAPDSSGNCWMDFHDMKISTDYTQTMTATVTVVKNRRPMVANSVTGYDQGALNYLYFRTADATQSTENVKAYLKANPVTLNYELKTPTETSFTTASLVTENAEIPLSNNDGVLIGKCTEQLSENPGFIDAKIKLSDSDGECYSNKLQLHVERSPQ